MVFLACPLAAVALFAQSQSLVDTPKIPAPSEIPAAAPEATPVLTPERRADIFMARKMYREALDVYRTLPQSNAVVLNKMGIAYHQMTDLENAKRFYERAVKLQPKYSEAINNLGTVHYARKSYRKAIGYYKKALRYAPKSASIYSNLGTAHFARKKYKDAFEAYQTALSLDPEVFEHRSTYGVMLQERSVAERAKFHYYLARTYAKAGVNDRALQYLRKALEEGFRERDKLKEDPEWAALRETPEFQELLAMQPRVL